MKGLEVLTPDCRQLALALDDDRLQIPWEGRSPRELTKIRMFLFSRREPQKSMSELVVGAQLELWPITNRSGRREVPAAVSLITPGTRRRRHG